MKSNFWSFLSALLFVALILVLLGAVIVFTRYQRIAPFIYSIQ